VTSIDDVVFQYASGLTTVTFEADSQLTSIGRRAFSDAINLKSIELPLNVVSIGDATFQRASSLESLHLSDTVTSLGRYVFRGASNLTIYTDHEEKTTNWDSDWNFYSRPVHWNIQDYGVVVDLAYAITANSEVVIRGLATNSGATDLIIPTTIEGFNVTRIQAYAFSGNTQLQSIYIPATILSIGEYAFQGADNIVINIEASEKPCGWHTDWNATNETVNWNVDQ
jgi:hypothetical protein